MLEIEVLRLAAEMAGNAGLIGILLYLLIQERAERQAARAEHIGDLRRFAREHNYRDQLDD